MSTEHASAFDEQRPSGLYVHVPFCRSKCGYCDFFSVPVADQPVERLAQALTHELEQRLADWPYPVRTIYCGGGTPTILPPWALQTLLAALGEVARTRAVTEFTVEANPGTLDAERAKLLADAGVTRLSLGAQSFETAELAVLERGHQPAEVATSLAHLRAVGIERVSLDLIFGIPGQTPASWSDSLQRALELEVSHLSCYGLAYEPGTALTASLEQGKTTRCPEALEAEMFEHAHDVLTAAGLRPYEISNYARPGCECAHNLLYWHNEPYLGIGPSAAGCDGRRRYRNVAKVADYLEFIERGLLPPGETEVLDDEALMHELLLMQLRMAEGLSVETFERRTGHDPLTLFAAQLEQLGDLVARSPSHIALTRQGRLLADRVIVELAQACPSGKRPA